jgi:hypothetical protein
MSFLHKKLGKNLVIITFKPPMNSLCTYFLTHNLLSMKVDILFPIKEMQFIINTKLIYVLIKLYHFSSISLFSSFKFILNVIASVECIVVL